MKQEVHDRFKDYKKDHCWQYENPSAKLNQ